MSWKFLLSNEDQMNRLVILQLLIFTLFTALLVVPVAAQENTESLRLSGAFTIEVPENWTIREYSASGYFWTTKDSEIRIRTYSPRFMDWYEIERQPDRFIEHMVVNIFEVRTFNAAQVESLEFGDYLGLGYTFEDVVEGRRYLRSIFLYQIENDFIVAGYISPLTGYDLNVDDVDAMKRAMETIAIEEEFVFFEGTQFRIGDNWQLTDDINDGWYSASALISKDKTIEIQFLLWPGYGAMAGLETPEGFLAWVFNRGFAYLGRFDRANAETIKIAGFDAVLAPLAADKLNAHGTYDRAVIAAVFPTNNTILTALVSTEDREQPLDPIFGVLDTIDAGRIPVCALFASPGIRIREEATTNSPVVRQTTDEVFVATRKTTDSNGYVWFDVGEGWIRSDVIYYENNSCRDVPFK